ncbi:MAG: tripartite tricarboxylate transporter substrate binding protein [Syntrophales bacterium]|nr:tripartite tricarboxylate transporter substrate binding protein [Syntrophales bacterium]
MKRTMVAMIMGMACVGVLIVTAFQPAFAAAAQANFPQKGRSITITAPNAPGGTADLTARLMAPVLEKELGIPVVVANKPGAGMQTGITAGALAKPDGYELIMTPVPGTTTIYMDPDRQAIPQIRQLQQVALHNLDVLAVVVNVQSPFQTVKDVVDAAKAKPGEVKAVTDGLMNADHMSTLYFQRKTGTKFRLVHFDSGALASTALAGGHVDVRFGKVGSVYALLKAGKLRIIGIMDNKRSKFCPEVKTLEEQGFKDYKIWYNATGLSAPKGTPRATVDLISNAIKKSVDSEDSQKRLDGVGLIGRYMGPDEFSALWKDYEKVVEEFVSEAKKP